MVRLLYINPIITRQDLAWFASNYSWKETGRLPPCLQLNARVFLSLHLLLAIISVFTLLATVEYAVSVWFLRIPLAQLSLLDMLQAKVCRRLLRSAKVTSDPHESKDNLNSLCVLESLQYRRLYLSMIIMFKYVHFHPDYLASFHILKSRSERRPNKLIFNNHGRISSSLFLHRIGKLWNCLPPSLTSIDSLSQFRQALRVHWAKYTFTCRGIDF